MQNLQGNLTKSVSLLMKALEKATMIKDLELFIVNQEYHERLPIVETFMNLSNSFSYLLQNEKALDYLDQAISSCDKILDILTLYIEKLAFNQTQNQALLQKYYNHMIVLKIHGHQAKGQIFDRLREYKDAVIAYTDAIDVVEAVYGTENS